MSSTSDANAQQGVPYANSVRMSTNSLKDSEDGLSLSLPRFQNGKLRRTVYSDMVQNEQSAQLYNMPDASNGDLQFIDDVEELKFALAQERSKNLALRKQNQTYRRNSTALSVEMEEEEEFLTNRFIRRLAALRKEKELLMKQVEQEEEMLTNRLQRKLQLVLQEKQDIENQLEAEQEYIANRLSHQLLETKNENFELQLQREAQRIESEKLIRQLEAERELNKRSYIQRRTECSGPLSPHSAHIAENVQAPKSENVNS